MKILDTAKGVCYLNLYGDIYIRDLNCYIKFYGTDSINFIDLENALKIGKTCRSVAIRFDYEWIGESKLGSFCSILNKIKPKDLENLISMIRNELQEFYPAKTYTEELKSIKVFSPFVKIKKIKRPNKWTISHIWKAILSGQIQKATQKYYYTDDYAFDAANNFSSGDDINLIELARDLVGSSGNGYRICENKEKSNSDITVIEIYNYGFDAKEVVFVN